MSNYPAPREIPAGKILVTPFGYVSSPDDRAVVELIAEAFAEHVAVRANVRLEWVSPGFESAGSAELWTNGYWACRWYDRSGARQGRRFKNDDEGEAAAREHFAKITAKESANVS